jgi:predicted Zn-dependent peptidase
MSRTLDEGTELHSANEFAAALERHGAAYGVDVSSDALHVEISVPVSHLAPAVALLAEAITRPAFNQADVGRHVTIRLGEINQERANAAYRAREAFASHLFDQSTRRSRPTAGTPDTIRPLTNVEVADFYRRNIGPERAEILFAGDATGVDAAAIIDEAFAGWTSGPGPASETPEPLYLPGNRVVLVNRPGSVQSQLLIGCKGPDRRDPLEFTRLRDQRHRDRDAHGGDVLPGAVEDVHRRTDAGPRRHSLRELPRTRRTDGRRGSEHLVHSCSPAVSATVSVTVSVRR